MKFQFLGTGAADWPNPGAKVGDGRRLTSMVVNDTLMVDCGSMTVAAVDEFGVDVNRLEAIVVGHPHDDHFDMTQIAEIARRRDPALPPLTVTVDQVACDLAEIPDDVAGRLQLRGFLPDQDFVCAGVKIHSLLANHHLETPGEIPCHLYMTFPTGETLFYALDGAWFVPKTWMFLQKHRMDYVIWELTCGNLADWRLWGHCNLTMVRAMADAFRADGSIHSGTVMFCSHLARTLCPPQAIYERELKTNGFILAKDGLVWQSDN